MPPSFSAVPALVPGAHVRVVAPASPFPREDFERGVARLRERYRVTFDDGIFAREGYLAGSDARRLAELHAALDDPTVDALVAARGGYGATRLLDALDLGKVRAARKLLVGFSDVTALHAAWARAGLRSIHGPMVAALGRAEPGWVDRWVAALEGAPHPAASRLTALSDGRAVEGPLVGGNLALCAALAGTPHAPPLDGAVLLLEDVGEAPYRVDRMLTTLRQAGWLERVAGVVLGLFTGCAPGRDGRTVTAVLEDRLGDAGVPVASGLNAGHAPDHVEVPLGARVRLDVRRGVLTFLEGAVHPRGEPAGVARARKTRRLRFTRADGQTRPRRPGKADRDMGPEITLEQYDITVADIIRNAPPARLYEHGLRNEPGTAIASSGALIAMSGEKTGRSPSDKRIVEEPNSQNEVWWGPINMPLDEHVFMINRERAIDYLNTRPHLYVVDGFAGWDPDYRIKVRIICSRAYHALFMHNMLIRPTAKELETFGEPDYVVINAGAFSANRHTSGMTSKTSVALHFGRKEFVILGTEYAGEMKKGVFTIMHYLMPKRDVLSMHCSANEGHDGDVSIFFGLSGTGKTTLSADPNRKLIGDDEHCWSDQGVFNIEGGCYAKAINLSPAAEPEIFNAIRFGSVLENVGYDRERREVDFTDVSITQNTRCSYPIEYIPNAKIPCVAKHPDNVILLTCDAFGVLPPVSKLTPAQAMYHFISGYTAKVAGTEVGVTEPEATFSACFGAPFLVWHPTKYAEMLADKLEKHGAQTWLVNTGWTGGPYGEGSRMSLGHTRAIIDAIHSGALAKAPTVEDPIFGVAVPEKCPGVPSEVLQPKKTWKNPDAYDETAKKLASLFKQNFETYEDQASEEIRGAGPRL